MCLDYLYQGLTAEEVFLVTLLLHTDGPLDADLAAGEPYTSQGMEDAYHFPLDDRINASRSGAVSPSFDMSGSLIRSLSIVEP